MKLNLGSGANRLDGFVNVDRSPECRPDRVVDLEVLPWPFDDSSAEVLVLSHVLEHLGRDPAVFLGIMRELYRVAAPGAEVIVLVPHPRHDEFLVDPTHVRAILPETLQLFSRRKNLEWRAQGAANTPLALQLGVDFEVERVNYVLDEPWRSDFDAGRVDAAAVREASRRHNNVIKQIECALRVVKPSPA